jgi:DNA mismatch repair protein MutS
MQNDKTTLNDLSFLSADGSTDVFSLIDHTTTQAGRDMLRRHIQHSADTYEALKEQQDAIKFWAANLDLWPKNILNGTLVMLDKYFESADTVSIPPGVLTVSLNGFFQKLFNKQEYFFIQFSLSHLSDFLKGCNQLTELQGAPPLMQREIDAIKNELKHRLTQPIMGVTKQTKFAELSRLNHDARREMKHMVSRLIYSYSKLDAWQSMARATVKHGWVFPEFLPAQPVCFEAKGLKHPLLTNPVSYDVSFGGENNFLLLTGANMSGKTTFMRALGVTALLAHMGMGVPARSLRTSFLHGVITQMQVEDNILRGESYFFAEVQRMKQTAEKLLQPQPQLALMDELFKGTNIHDAYECTKAVIEGLLRHNNHLMVLSTHLYEVAQQFSNNTGVQFCYFVTQIIPDGGYHFTYELKEGISNDRIGYRILQQEGVIALLHKKQ